MNPETNRFEPVFTEEELEEAKKDLQKKALERQLWESEDAIVERKEKNNFNQYLSKIKAKEDKRKNKKKR